MKIYKINCSVNYTDYYIVAKDFSDAEAKFLSVYDLIIKEIVLISDKVIV